MATKAALTSVADVSLGNKGLVITVHSNGEILGHLMVGKANLIWFEKNKKKRGHKAPWSELREWFMEREEEEATRP